MNITVTNSTLNFLDDQLSDIGSLLFVCIQIMNFSLGIPVCVYLLFFLVKTQRMDMAFVLSQCLSEIIYALSAPLYILCQVDVNSCFIKLIDFFIVIFLSSRPIFQCCVCLERYVAVVHPVFYIKFKPLKYRLGCLIVIWTYVLFCSFTSLLTFSYMPFNILEIIYIIILVVELFCYVTILRVLKQPGPGDKNIKRKDSGKTDSKMKAYEIVSISLLIFLIQAIPVSIVFALRETAFLSGAIKLATAIAVAVNICASFTQALIYLYKAGKLPFPK